MPKISIRNSFNSCFDEHVNAGVLYACVFVVMSIDAEISCQFRMIRLNTHAKMATKSLSSVDLSAILSAE